MENILINIDSRFRNKILYPNSAKFSIKLGNKIKNVNYIKISSFEFPNLYYTFTQYKNNTSFSITSPSITSPLTAITSLITINDGNYDNVDLITELNNNLSATGVSIVVPINNNNKIKITSLYPFSIDFNNSIKDSSLDNSLGNSLGNILGFTNNTYTSLYDSTSTPPYYIESENQIYINNDNYFFIKINEYGTIYNSISVYNKGYKLNTNTNINIQEYELNINNFLAKVILNSTDKNVYDNNNFITKEYKFRQITNIDKFDIELIDPYFNTLILNNLDYSLTLEIGYNIIDN